MHRIAHVEDDSDIRDTVSRILTVAGYTVDSYETHGDFIKALDDAALPDLAILDVMMPNRNGFEVCQDLRQDPEFKTLRIMMLTAKGRDTEVSKGLALGADVYMTKPFATRDLLAKVKALLERA